MLFFDEAIEEMKRALELDPLSLIINTDVGFDSVRSDPRFKVLMEKMNLEN